LEATYSFDTDYIVYQFKKIWQTQAIASISIKAKPFQ
jgi:hypothetical protein